MVVIHAFAESLTTVFLYAVPVVIVASILAWMLEEVPLRNTAHGSGGDERAAPAAAMH